MPKSVKNRPCNYQGCPEIATGPYCDKHKRTDRRVYADYQKLYNTRAWKRLREMHLRKYPFCLICGSIYKRQVDHIEDHKGDTDLFFDSDNLQTLCHVHHSQKTMKVINEI